jgi:hypothetical protein
MNQLAPFRCLPPPCHARRRPIARVTRASPPRLAITPAGQLNHGASKKDGSIPLWQTPERLTQDEVERIKLL